MVPDPWLQTFIQQYQALCPLCQVPLHPQSDQCLRCRRKIQLGVKVLESYMLAWGITVCTLALESGIGFIFLYVLLLDGVRSWRKEEYVFLGVGSMGVLTTLAIVLALLFRRGFCNMPRVLQWSAVGISGTILLISLVLVQEYIR